MPTVALKIMYNGAHSIRFQFTRSDKTVCRKEGGPIYDDYLSAAAPEIISTSSLVMTACRWRLYIIVILSIISPKKQSSTHLSHLAITNSEHLSIISPRDLQSFKIRFRIELPIRDSIRSDDPIRILESSAPSIVLCKETIGGG